MSQAERLQILLDKLLTERFPMITKIRVVVLDEYIVISVRVDNTNIDMSDFKKLESEIKSEVNKVAKYTSIEILGVMVTVDDQDIF
jgi:hypothetical protein